MPDFIPKKDSDFNIFQSNLLAIVQTNIVAWGIPQADFAAVTTTQTAWQTSFARASNKQNRTSADVQAKDDNRHVHEKAIRNFIAQWLTHNPKVPDSERERMGLTVRDKKRTATTAQGMSLPVATVDFSVALQHTINFADINANGSKAKPAGIHGCEIWHKIGDPAPTDIAEFTYLATDTATPYVATYTSAAAGKTVYYRLRWVNTTGTAGPWNSVVSAMVAG